MPTLWKNSTRFGQNNFELHFLFVGQLDTCRNQKANFVFGRRRANARGQYHEWIASEILQNFTKFLFYFIFILI